MNECCDNCKHRFEIEKLDYSQGGCEHSKPGGFICMAFAFEGVASWMVGIDGSSGQCEVWSRKVEKNE